MDNYIVYYVYFYFSVLHNDEKWQFFQEIRDCCKVLLDLSILVNCFNLAVLVLMQFFMFIMNMVILPGTK